MRDLKERSKGKKEESEMGPGKKGLLVCEKCDAYYWKKGWHHNSAEFISRFENRHIPMKKALCPADMMIKNKMWEGEVVIENVAAGDKVNLLNLIRNACQKDFDRDVLDRLVSLTEEKGNIVARTTENQMAQSLGRKIKETFKNRKPLVKITHEKEPSDLTEVRIRFT